MARFQFVLWFYVANTWFLLQLNDESLEIFNGYLEVRVNVVNGVQCCDNENEEESCAEKKEESCRENRNQREVLEQYINICI